MSNRPARSSAEATLLDHLRQWYQALLCQRELAPLLPREGEHDQHYDQYERVLSLNLHAADRDVLLAPLLERFDTIEHHLAKREAPADTVVQAVHTRLDAIEHHLAELTRLHTSMVQTHTHEQHTLSGHTARLSADLAQTQETLQQVASDLQAELETLKKQVNRSGKEQLKANSLTETQLERLSEALTMLREAEQHREQGLLSLHEQRQAERTAARREVVYAMLPVIDSLEEAMRSGKQMLDQMARPEPAEQPRPEPEPHPDPEAGFFERLFGRARKEPPPPPPATEPSSPGAGHPAPRVPETMRKGVSVWLDGLAFIIQRLLDILAAEGVSPIEALGHRFDPQRHMAVEVVAASDDTPDGTVVAEMRRGYMEDERVLRHAEVVVARRTGSVHEQPSPPGEAAGETTDGKAEHQPGTEANGPPLWNNHLTKHEGQR